MTKILYGTVLSPPCRVVLVTAEALGVPLELKTLDLAKKEHLSPEFLKINPQHTIPTLDDEGLIVVDSHAIITYLVSKYGKDDSLYPKDLGRRALVDARLHFDSGNAFSILKNVFTSHLYFGQTAYLTEWQSLKIADAYDLINAFLGRTKWIAGNSFTVADVAVAITVNSLEAIVTVDDTKYPNVRPWLNAANALPYFSINKEGIELYKQVWKRISSH